jgi:D-alanyl-D-alanine carboxypeptidase/D-alanyl-D-alanine-endopeptidase (penicillin-binding protein 4)
MTQRPRRLGLWVVIGLFVLSVVGSAAGVSFANDIADVVSGAPPTAWRSGTPAADLAVLPPAADGAPLPDGTRLQSIIDPLRTDPALGPSVNVHVMDVATGQPLAGHNNDALTVPASSVKLVAAVTALTALGPTHQFATKAVAGAAPGEVVLVGGGDPTLMRGPGGVFPAGAATLSDLSDQVKRALGGTAPTKVTFDASVFAGPPFGTWDEDIPTNGVVCAIVGLMIDGGRVNASAYTNRDRVSDPDVSAAQAFATLLGVSAAPVRGTAPQGARELGTVLSLPVERQVEIMLTESDNVIAESMARQVAIKRGKPVTFEGGAAAMKETLAELGLPADVDQQVDGSGLARVDKVAPSLLAKIVALATKPDHPELRAIVSGMPVSGFSGTLAGRFRQPNAVNARGIVRAKTGTLRSVYAIAGLVTTVDGRQLAFAVLADNAPVGVDGPAQNALDRIVAAVAACGCR